MESIELLSCTLQALVSRKELDDADEVRDALRHGLLELVRKEVDLPQAILLTRALPRELLQQLDELHMLKDHPDALFCCTLCPLGDRPLSAEGFLQGLREVARRLSARVGALAVWAHATPLDGFCSGNFDQTLEAARDAAPNRLIYVYDMEGQLPEIVGAEYDHETRTVGPFYELESEGIVEALRILRPCPYTIDVFGAVPEPIRA